MKRIVLLTLAVMALGIVAWAQDVSLGDYARQQRDKQKPASPTTHVFTNDDIGAAPAASAPADTSAASSTADKDKDAKAKDKEKTKAEQMSAEAADFKAKVADIKAKIAEIQRNIDVSNREYKLRSIEWYTQAGNALLDPKKFKDQGDAHEKEIADLQKQLAEQNAELDKVRDEIRKAGLSSSVGD